MVREKSLISKKYRKLFPTQLDEIGAELKGCESLLDLACGSSSPVQFFSGNFYSVGVDIFQPSIEKSQAAGIHSAYRIFNILDAPDHFGPASFDCVVAFDVIEHLSKEDGMKLMGAMEKIAKKKVIILTPNGFLPQSVYDGNDWQLHISGWEVDEMRGLGYRVSGIHGLKALRGERAAIRFKPFIFWQFMSDLTQLFTKHTPRKAFKILCVKDIGA